MIVAKDCQFYEGYRKCSALNEQDCYQCKFYKKRLAKDVEEAIRLYAIRKDKKELNINNNR